MTIPLSESGQGNEKLTSRRNESSSRQSISLINREISTNLDFYAQNWRMKKLSNPLVAGERTNKRPNRNHAPTWRRIKSIQLDIRPSAGQQ